jgi:hypothetical protein
VVNGTMVATSEAARSGSTQAPQRTLASARTGVAVGALGVALAVPWAASPSTAVGQGFSSGGSAVEVQRPQSRPEQSSVGEIAYPARYPRQVRVPSNSSVAPSDTSSVDAATDDAAIGMVSPTDDGDVHAGGVPVRPDADAAGGSLGGFSRSGRSTSGHPADDAPVPFLDDASMLDPVTAVVGLDSHGHPWDEQPPPVVDLGQAIDELP